MTTALDQVPTATTDSNENVIAGSLSSQAKHNADGNHVEETWSLTTYGSLVLARASATPLPGNSGQKRKVKHTMEEKRQKRWNAKVNIIPSDTLAQLLASN